MILTTASIAVVVLALFSLWGSGRTFYQNVKAAKHSGVPYIIVPIFLRDLWWLITQSAILPIFDRLPSFLTQSWLPVIVMRRVWHEGYEPFARVGSDSFFAVSPRGSILWTCDPTVINQLHGRRGDFHKPVEMLGVLNMYGPTVTGTEGPESRTYRKIASPSFNDGTHNEAWKTSLAQAGMVLDRWKALTAKSSAGILIQDDVARMTLHILSWCAYGRKMDWDYDKDLRGVVPQGHTMSYTEAIASMLARLPIIFFTPPKVLHSSPMEIHKKALESFNEAKKYMEELRDDKQAELRGTFNKRNPNLLDALVQSSEYEGRRHDALAGSIDAKISQEAVLGNIFIFILAGHETNANTTVFALTVMACYPKIQRKVQESIDRIVGDRDPSEWTYEKDFPRLLDSYPGALMNEILRLYTVLPFFAKITGDAPTTLNVNDRECVLPPKTSILINTSATHRNPKYWGVAPKSDADLGELKPFPVSSFNLEKWIDGFTPAPAAFIPFGDGARACMGQRFAKTSFLATISRILKSYSAELAVEGNDYNAWARAKGAAEKELSQGVDFTLALKMNKGVPLHFTLRGSERWPDVQC